MTTVPYAVKMNEKTMTQPMVQSMGISVGIVFRSNTLSLYESYAWKIFQAFVAGN